MVGSTLTRKRQRSSANSNDDPRPSPLSRLVSREFSPENTSYEERDESRSIVKCKSMASSVTDEEASRDFMEDDEDDTNDILDARQGNEVDETTIKLPIQGPSDSPVRSVVSFNVVEPKEDMEDDGHIGKKPFSGHPVSVSFDVRQSPSALASDMPCLPSVHDQHWLDQHLLALRVEKDLLPVRPLLNRLMSHSTYNRHNIFNVPVDTKALNIPDYDTIIPKKMDLGTIKSGLYANAYLSLDDVSNDIRLVFVNAMKYNPPIHFVHKAAAALLEIFEDGHQRIVSQSSSVLPVVDCDSPESRSGLANLVSEDSKTHAVFSGPAQPPKAPVIPKSVQSPLKPQASNVSTPHGPICALCRCGCLPLEPTLLVCFGSGCSGAKIRKGAHYYCCSDGSRHWCHKCYSNLPAVLPQDCTNSEGRVQYKRDLLKRKNEEEVAETWTNCDVCGVGMHKVCALYNDVAVIGRDNHVCPLCVAAKSKDYCKERVTVDVQERYTFVTGQNSPQPLRLLGGVVPPLDMKAESIPLCNIASFIQDKVRDRIVSEGCAPPNSEHTVTIRVISDCEKSFQVPDIIRRHFRADINEENPQDVSEGADRNGRIMGGKPHIPPPHKVNYRSKAIALFQRIDGLDVCVFCMYVQEYGGCHGNEQQAEKKRVYIAYLDSVEHFRPGACRTSVYQEILVSYMATARARGYETAHIWACPPSRGNSFVFWSHPASQRTPTRERLAAWYHSTLSRAVRCGVVTDVRSFYEHSFQKFDRLNPDAAVGGFIDSSVETVMVCPPLFDGDFWTEEVVREHAAAITRFMKSKSRTKPLPVSEGNAGLMTPIKNLPHILCSCPAIHVASLIQHCILTHPLSVPFQRPVNAAALNLKDYHDIIKKPMDLGTVHCRVLLGEFGTLADLVSDVDLVFKNAMKYNPKGHVVHKMAIDLWDLFQNQLGELCKYWNEIGLDVSIDESKCVHEPSAKENVDCGVGDHVKSGAKSCVPADSASAPLNSTCAPPPAWMSYMDLSMRLSANVCLLNKEPNVLCQDDEPDGTGSNSFPEDKGCSTNRFVTDPSLGKPQSKKAKATKRPRKGGAGPRIKSRSKEPAKLDFLTGGPPAIAQRMIGDDLWILDKKNGDIPCTGNSGKKKKKTSDACDSVTKPPNKRRQSWLGDEICSTIRRMRRDFFVCELKPQEEMTEAEKEKVTLFENYAGNFFSDHEVAVPPQSVSPCVADTRHGLLEFFQYHGFQFDTLRRAKYSTAMLLYYLRNPNSPGLSPYCSSCGNTVTAVRWHNIKHSQDQLADAPKSLTTNDLCGQCHSNSENQDDFIPVRVSFCNQQQPQKGI